MLNTFAPGRIKNAPYLLIYAISPDEKTKKEEEGERSEGRRLERKKRRENFQCLVLSLIATHSTSKDQARNKLSYSRLNMFFFLRHRSPTKCAGDEVYHMLGRF